MDKEKNDLKKQGIAVVGSIVLCFLIYYGSYLPFKKSETFITTLKGMDSLRSVEDVEVVFDEVFDIPSPIGQEEVIRHFASVILSTIQRFNASQVPASEQLVSYIEKKYQPIIESERGMSFNQNLFVLGSLNQIVFLQTKNPKYLAAAETYYTKGVERSPKRPQFLYASFDLNRIKNDSDKVREIANKILTLWPEDQNTKKAAEEFLKKSGSSLGE